MSKRRKKRGESRSIENPNVPISVAAFNDDASFAFGGSGVRGSRVNPRRALGYPAFWRAVNLISSDVGKIPLVVYKKSGRNREAAPTHPAYRLLASKPNRNTTAYIFKQTLQAHVLIEGNGYAYIDRNGAGMPLELLILDPDKVDPTKIGGDVWYVYDTGNEKRRIPSSDVLHFKGLGFDGLRGYPVLKYMSESMGAALGARDFSANYFKNGTRPGGVLKSQKTLTPQARSNMRESWERLHKGLENSHKVAILEEGTEYQAFESNARNAQLLESRQFDAREIANIFGVPSHKLGDSDKVAYNSLGEENQSYLNDTLSSWFVMWSQEATDKLCSEAEKRADSHFADFEYAEIQRANPAAQMDYVTKAKAAGILNADEGRAIIGWNSRADGGGEKYDDKPAENQPDMTAQKDPKPPENTPKRGISPALRLLVGDVSGRMVRRLATHAERAAKSGKLGEWCDGEHADHKSVIADAFKPLVLVAHERGTGGSVDAETLAAFLVSQTVELVGRDATADSIQWATTRLIVPQISGMIADELGG